jgi:maltose-binding protein MalE
MKKYFMFFIIALFVSCASAPAVDESKPVSTGWSDEDTYTVVVTEKTMERAVEQAKHQILKDIVNVRVSNQSRYTDIVKIRDEFDIPLKKGRIVSKKELPEGIQIYFQIRDTGLKEKFQRK